MDGEALDEKNVEEVLGDADGILVPGGFGLRGIEGKVCAVRRARTHKVPYLGVCLGLQVAVCEFARDVCGLAGASSAEFDACTPHPVIDLMPDQANVTEKGGTMRLGAYPCKVVDGTLAAEAYGEPLVYERHRHRYEVSNAYREQLVSAGSSSPASPRTGGSWRWWSFPRTLTPGSWRARRTPSSRAAPTARRRSSASSCAPQSRTTRAATGMTWRHEAREGRT